MEFTKEELIAKNPNYRYKFMGEEELRDELKNWSRIDKNFFNGHFLMYIDF